GRSARDRRAQAGLERGSRPQAAGEILRGPGPDPCADALGPPAPLVALVPMKPPIGTNPVGKTPGGKSPAGKTPAGMSPGGARSAFDPDFADLPQTIPIFPLQGVLLLPGGKLPLNVFEPRYLAMVRAALAGPRLIGMIQPRDPDAAGLQPEVQKVGCAGRIVSFAETDDNRY